VIGVFLRQFNKNAKGQKRNSYNPLVTGKNKTEKTEGTEIKTCMKLLVPMVKKPWQLHHKPAQGNKDGKNERTKREIKNTYLI
jgi:hypothetical protein